MIGTNPSHATGGNYRQQLLEHALAYANTGWPVFPLRPGTKRPATPNHTAHNCNGTDPRCAWNGHTGWEQRATTDPGRIQRAWDQHPYGIGIACGPAGLVVIDLDTGHGISGADSLRQLEHEHGQAMPATFTVATPSGGRHLYYQQPPGTEIRNSAGTIAPAVDIRAAGGYIAAPPTQLTNGDSYHIIDDHLPAVLPVWFSELLNPPRPPAPVSATLRRPPSKPDTGATCDDTRLRRYVQAAINGELRRITGAPVGQRNQSLLCASIALGQLVGANAINQTEAEQLLEHAAANHYGTPQTDPFTRAEAHQTITSGLRRGIKEPRQLPTTATTKTFARTA